MRFFEKISAFMQGRYGMDSLNIFLLVVQLTLWFTHIFVWNYIARIVIWCVEMALLGLVIFRALSRNINMRSLENRQFKKVWDPVKNWFMFQIKKFRERKEYKYLKCPHCKAQLRVRNKKGEHGVRCPKCRGEFKVKI